MTDNNKEISEKIRDGSYYEEAKQWYFRKYLSPITDRSYVLVIACLIGIAFLISAYNTWQLKKSMDAKRDYPFIVNAENSTDDFSHIKSLGDDSETAQQAIAKYLVIDYIRTREEYTKDMLGEKYKRILKKIKRTSTASVLSEYKNYMNDLNPYSPLIRYSDHSERKIEIKSFSFLDNDITSGKADVIFDAIVINDNGKTETSQWEATVHFRLPNVENISETGSTIRFIIKYYRAKPLN